MRRIHGVLGILAMLAMVGYILFFMERELPPPPGWPSDIKLYRKQALGGLTRVFDTKSGQFLFYYLPEYDRHVHPIKIERVDERHWQVTFEAPK